MFVSKLEKCLAVTLSTSIKIGAEEGFQGVVDLINFRGITWNEEDMGMTFQRFDIPADIVMSA